MNGKRSKAIRRQVYGDNVSAVSGRSYRLLDYGWKILKWINKAGAEEEFKVRRVTVRSADSSLRLRYQHAKRDTKQGPSVKFIRQHVSRTELTLNSKRARAIAKGAADRVDCERILKSDSFLAEQPFMSIERLRRVFAVRWAVS